MKLGDVFTEVCLGLYTPFKNSKAFFDSFFFQLSGVLLFSKELFVVFGVLRIVWGQK